MDKNIADFFFIPTIIKWWEAVSVIPDLNKINVLSKGIVIGLNLLIPLHGQFCPIKISGDKDAWKNAQKKDKKKNTSDVINSIIPIFNPLITSLVCRFSNVDSRIISRHQKNAIVDIKTILIKNISDLELNIFAVENTILNTCIDAKIGHGLWETKWNGTKILVISIFLEP